MISAHQPSPFLPVCLVGMMGRASSSPAATASAGAGGNAGSASSGADADTGSAGARADAGGGGNQSAKGGPDAALLGGAPASHGATPPIPTLDKSLKTH